MGAGPRCLPKPSRGLLFLTSIHPSAWRELDWWHEAVLGMLLWATRVGSAGERLGARDRVAHLPARCRSTARPTRPRAEGALPDLAGPGGPRDGFRAGPAQHRDPPGG